MHLRTFVFVPLLSLVFFFILEADSSGLETITAILGILPTTEIIAGGGLIGLKLAIAARILALLGYIPGRHGNATELNVTTSSPLNVTASSYLLPSNIFSYLGFGHKMNTTTTTPLPLNSSLPANITTPHSPTHHDFGADYFPIPSFKVDKDNETGKYAILQSDDNYPSVMVPHNYVNNYGNGGQAMSFVDNLTSPLLQYLNLSQDQSYLFYPLLPTNVVANNLQEPGYLSISNASQLLGFSNGTFKDLDNNEFEFQGYRSGADLANETVQAEENDLRLPTKHSRAKRAIADYIPRYFDLIYTLDEQECFSKLICEIGANSTAFGRYGHSLKRFLSSLDEAHMQHNSTSEFYVLRFQLGRVLGLDACADGINCPQNMTKVIASINAL